MFREKLAVLLDHQISLFTLLLFLFYIFPTKTGSEASHHLPFKPVHPPIKRHDTCHGYFIQSMTTGTSPG